MAKVVQVLSNLNENFFDCEPKVRFDFGVKKFCGSSLVLCGGVVDLAVKKVLTAKHNTLYEQHILRAR
jgi:hypothetical protein